MTLDIVGTPEEREINYTTTPTPELLPEAEQYIFDLIDNGLEAYREKVEKWETNKHFHLYFGHSKNDELKAMWDEFLKPIRVERQKQKELAIKKIFDDNLAKEKERGETYEGKYEITNYNETRIVIGMEKPGKGRDKSSFAYSMTIEKNDTPQFFKYCIDNLPRYKPN